MIADRRVRWKAAVLTSIAKALGRAGVNEGTEPCLLTSVDTPNVVDIEPIARFSRSY